MCTVLLPPGGYTIAVNKHININKPGYATNATFTLREKL
jgi:hypothetical protein